MSVDYALRRFRTYLIGSQHEIVIVTDHSPFLKKWVNKNWKNKTKKSGHSFLFKICKGTRQLSRLFKQASNSLEISKKIREKGIKLS